MATTSRPISELFVGIRDTAGVVVASGKVRFYQPGTLVTQSVFSDSACASAITQPYTLNAAGQGTVYTLEAVRMIVKDSTETTTHYDDIVNLNRHDAVYVTSPQINGGAETTLEAVLASASTSFGAGLQYKVAAGGVARNVNTVISERMVSVKDFGAVGDGITNDYAAIQATIDYVASLGGGIVFFPVGTYLTNTGLTNVTVGVSFLGAGRALSTIKNGSVTNTALAYNVGAAVDCKAFVRDLGITASTTSSGSAIVVTNGDRMSISGVSTGLHRTGLDCNAITAARVCDSSILSTDDNAAAIGIRVGVRGRVVDCEAISGTTNGTGIVLNGSNSQAIDCYAEKFATAISATATNSGALRCTATSATTGISLSGAAAFADLCRAASNTTGISVGGVASARVFGATYSGNTTDLSVSNSASNFYELGNWATLSAGTAGNLIQPVRSSFTTTTVAVGGTWTPTHTPGAYQHLRGTGGPGNITVAAPTGATKMVGDTLYFQFFTTVTSTHYVFNSTYKQANGSTTCADLVSGGNNVNATTTFVWNGTVYILATTSQEGGGTSPQV